MKEKAVGTATPGATDRPQDPDCKLLSWSWGNPLEPYQAGKLWPVQCELFCSDVGAEGEKFSRDDSQIPERAEVSPR